MDHPHRLSLWAFALLVLALQAASALLEPSIIAGPVQTGESRVQFISDSHGLDAPKVQPVNGTVFDWWYFDAVSDVDKSSVVITFFTSTAVAFPFLEESPVVTSVYIWTSYANGTTGQFIVDAESAVVNTMVDGTSGVFSGTGMSWGGTPDMAHYVVDIDAPEVGVQGSLYLESRAPAHYPCGPAEAGQDMQILPHVGWANAVPDAKAYANFEVLGEPISFTGAGYHDKNWSDRTFAESVSSWLWGHASLGPYSIVWFDALDTEKNEFVSGYVARDGQMLTGDTCTTDLVKVRLSNSAWPPNGTQPDAYLVEIDLGDDGVLEAVAHTELVVAGLPDFPYTRWIGNITGTLGSETLSGVAVFEQFVLG
ncbi:hypothetical protein CPB85DRAFT_1294961 [Mucidula mucida]|nr:hypothetical protein CPB85DRAFT_1294961 [Mucidula mucida]